MAQYYDIDSRTFSEYLLIPNLTTEECRPQNISLKTPLVRHKKENRDKVLSLNIPLTSAIMQSVSDSKLAIALARTGGLSFIFGSQSIESQASMVETVKNFKAGIVKSDTNITKDSTITDLIALIKKTGHSTVAVTDDGSPNGRLEGLITSRDYRLSKVSADDKVSKYMTDFDHLVYGKQGISLSEANNMIWDNKLNQLPIVDSNNKLIGLVFRKDYDEHKEHPLELLDEHKRLIVGAGINTRDYEERVPELVKAGVDVLCIDSSDGFSVWQERTIKYIKENYPHIPCGAGNVVDREGFRFLAEAGADFIKVGIGGGSICITRETKGIGCGQATALQVVSKARDEWFDETGEYIPICSDGGIVYDYHMTLALAMGADFLMLGRYFARFEEAPGNRLLVNGNYVKEYWGEGSNRARNWQRYDEGTSEGGMVFEEGVDSYVSYAGPLKENVDASLAKIKATMCSCGSVTLPEFQQKARLIRVSATSIIEGGAHDVMLRNSEQRR